MGAVDADAEGSFASLADSIMQQLLSKDVLYQPMKDIGAKYPAWLASRRCDTFSKSKDDMQILDRTSTIAT